MKITLIDDGMKDRSSGLLMMIRCPIYPIAGKFYELISGKRDENILFWNCVQKKNESCWIGQSWLLTSPVLIAAENVMKYKRSTPPLPIKSSGVFMSFLKVFGGFSTFGQNWMRVSQIFTPHPRNFGSLSIKIRGKVWKFSKPFWI